MMAIICNTIIMMMMAVGCFSLFLPLLLVVTLLLPYDSQMLKFQTREQSCSHNENLFKAENIRREVLVKSEYLENNTGTERIR